MLCGRGQRWETGGGQAGDRVRLAHVLWPVPSSWASGRVSSLAHALWPGALAAASTRSSCDWPAVVAGAGPLPSALRLNQPSRTIRQWGIPASSYNSPMRSKSYFSYNAAM